MSLQKQLPRSGLSKRVAKLSLRLGGDLAAPYTTDPKKIHFESMPVRCRVISSCKQRSRPLDRRILCLPLALEGTFTLGN